VSDHTPEPALDSEALDTARRIAACVNFCKGYTTEELEKAYAEGQRLYKEALELAALYKESIDKEDGHVG